MDENGTKHGFGIYYCSAVIEFGNFVNDYPEESYVKFDIGNINELIRDES